jgi:hypothetical protein
MDETTKATTEALFAMRRKKDIEELTKRAIGVAKEIEQLALDAYELGLNRVRWNTNTNAYFRRHE